MNKRARLARRILREHRRMPFLHFEYENGKEYCWYCPHCVTWARPGRVNLMRVPRAYR